MGRSTAFQHPRAAIRRNVIVPSSRIEARWTKGNLGADPVERFIRNTDQPGISDPSDGSTPGSSKSEEARPSKPGGNQAVHRQASTGRLDSGSGGLREPTIPSGDSDAVHCKSSRGNFWLDGSSTVMRFVSSEAAHSHA